uniref:Replication initiation factor domain-containing protein n=1 Tax=Herbaspirillum huttiense subsp. nephrolepidis TaxID=3075126 RepID=A0AAE4GFI7_9BURK
MLKRFPWEIKIMSLTKVDWFGFRTKATPHATLEGLRGVFSDVGSGIRVNPRKRGWMGFEQSADISIGQMHIGLMAFGGDSQKGWVSVNISGRGCEWVRDWDSASDIASTLPQFEARRVDLALDTYQREVTHNKVMRAHRDGLFTTCGRPPEAVQIQSTDKCAGRTVYIGSRDQGKFLRAYEKGFELVKSYANGDEITHIDGYPVEDIYRLELELKPKLSPLPVDLIPRRDEYFSGAYPYLQKVIDIEPEVWQQKRERGPQMDLEASLSQIKHQYGSSLFTAVAAYQGDIGAVWNKIVGTRHNEHLLEKGVLLVDHT